MQSMHINNITITKENANRYIIAYETSNHYAPGVTGYSRSWNAYAPVDFFEKRKDASDWAKAHDMKTFFKKAPKKNIKYYGESVGQKSAKVHYIKVKDFIAADGHIGVNEYLFVNIIPE